MRTVSVPVPVLTAIVLIQINVLLKMSTVFLGAI